VLICVCVCVCVYVSSVFGYYTCISCECMCAPVCVCACSSPIPAPHLTGDGAVPLQVTVGVGVTGVGQAVAAAHLRLASLHLVPGEACLAAAAVVGALCGGREHTRPTVSCLNVHLIRRHGPGCGVGTQSKGALFHHSPVHQYRHN